MSRVTQPAKSGRYVAAAVAVFAGIAYATQGGPSSSREPSTASNAMLAASEPPQPVLAAPPTGHSLNTTAGQLRLPPSDRAAAQPELVTPTDSSNDTGIAKVEAAPARADIKIVPRIAATLPPAPQTSLSAPVVPMRNEPAAAPEPTEVAQAPEAAPIATQRPLAKRDQTRRKPMRATVTETGCVPFIWPGDHGHPDRWKTVCGSRSKPSRKS
jgi:hypothetical protein